MRVLFVTNRYPTTDKPGDSPCIAQQRAAIQLLGYDVDVLLILSQQSKLNYLKAAWQVLWTTQIKRRYDLIHAHYGFYCGLVACLQFSTPVVVTFRGSDVLNQHENAVSRLVAKFSSAVIVMTNEMKQVLGREDAHVIPYGIDLGVFKPCPQAEARQSLGLPLDAPLVLFPYDPERKVKRFDLIQQATDLLKVEFPDINLVVIYDKQPATVATYMNACDVLVLTSDREGAPVAVREAMACNLPIVSVDVGDVAEVMGNTEGCYLVKPDATDIARKLAQVLRTKNRTNGWLAAQKMSLSQVAADVATIYNSLLRDGLDRHHESLQASLRRVVSGARKRFERSY